MMRMILVVFFFLSLASAYAQYDHQGVFPDKEGIELRQLVIENFRPGTVLSYGQARDTLYGIVYNVNDTIAGIYSDHKKYLQPGADPTTYLFDDGDVNGINAEHSYPQSKGAGSGNPKSDMHHLFPSRVATNSARGSLPFAEVNDNNTETWYFRSVETSSTPSASTIDEYSERGSDRWEPREEAKGNIARAIFYFYTMYQDQADNADPNFFNLQKETLCDWHSLDPVDQLEWERTNMIAKWQDDRSNPFVLDCTLAYRMYCGDVPEACTIVDIDPTLEKANLQVVNNPAHDAVFFEAYDDKKLIAYHIYSMSSSQQIKHQKVNHRMYAGEKYKLDLQELTKGSYIVQWLVQDIHTGQQYTIPYKIIKM